MLRYALRYSTCIVVFFLMANLCEAQNPTDADQQTIRELAQQIKELQEKVALLESRQAARDPDPVNGGNQPSAQEQPLTSDLDSHNFRGIHWRGFGEVNYKVLDQRTPELGTFGFVPGSAGNFFVGDFDLLLTSAITDKASVLSEIVIGEDDAQSFSVDLERVLFKYDYNDHLKASFGRYHTGIGYYNTAFHSGKWLQTTADRPLIMEFANDGGLLPTQAVGVSVTGSIPSGSLGLNYLVEYGSSDTIRPELNEPEAIEEDENNGNNINFGLFARPDWAPGLQIGASFYHDQISDFQRGPTVRLGQTIVNAHVVYASHNIEFLSEGFLLRHDYEQNGPAYNMPAFYTQFSRKFCRIRPYFRYQYINANPRSIFEDVGLRGGPSFGARYDFNTKIGFKAQMDHTLRKELPDLNGLQLQLVFAF
jgi:hypothetical protein